jgi:hypothetical protein
VSEFERFCQLLSGIRERYAVRTAHATEHDSRPEEWIDRKKRALEEAAAHRRHEANLRRAAEEARRAAEEAIRSGGIRLDADCPRGHGRLRDWEGKPRCWKCGWPWKDLIPPNWDDLLR